ncbi:putative small GTPase superfamily, SAR1 family protein [Lyophyllum shimeji]|uniref:Small GTPase superfamily, SAR1 family protein n=1 Tax=Lyophyllum shimeji TaxID=47721 RepID=A0A9P3PEM4_LYOSH|nr:putative small GTPase superfamily, SAR1 family protein [Lyophyllum shimeji]
MSFFNRVWDDITQLELSQKNARILFLGPFNSRKRALLHVLKNGTFAALAPTIHPASEEITLGKGNFTAYELGGQALTRRRWRDYFDELDGVVFVVDSADVELFAESKEELDALLVNEQLANVPILVSATRSMLRVQSARRSCDIALAFHRPLARTNPPSVIFDPLKCSCALLYTGKGMSKVFDGSYSMFERK